MTHQTSSDITGSLASRRLLPCPRGAPARRVLRRCEDVRAEHGEHHNSEHDIERAVKITRGTTSPGTGVTASAVRMNP